LVCERERERERLVLCVVGFKSHIIGHDTLEGFGPWGEREQRAGSEERGEREKKEGTGENRYEPEIRPGRLKTQPNKKSNQSRPTQFKDQRA